MSAEARETDANHVVTIARHGTRMARRSDVFLNYAQYGEPDSPLQMDYFVWFIRNGDHTIMVDTGYSAEGARVRNREVLIDFPTLLERVGVKPEDISLVIVSHAHYDHIGNLNALPHARFLISKLEVDFWNGPNAEKPLFEHSVENDEIAYLNSLIASGRVDFFSGSHRPAPGIEVIEVGGHTPGQSIVLVQTSDGPVLLTSDAMHYYEELESDRPFTSVTDVVGMYDAFHTIRDLVTSGRAQHLVSGHDPGTLQRFTPVPGLEGVAAHIGHG